MRIWILKHIRIAAFALSTLDMSTFVTKVIVKNDPLCLTIIKYKENRRNKFKAFE